MEISVIGNNSQVMIPGREDLASRESRFCNFSCDLSFRKGNSICYGRTLNFPRSSLRLTLKASSTGRSGALVTTNVPRNRKSKQNDGLKLYVGLPLDAVSDYNTINHEKAIAAGLKALKLLGVEGVELPIWWGVVEKEAMGKYDWTGYLALAELVQKLGLKLHVSLCFHASNEPKIPLPVWVSRIGESQPNIFFADQSGRHYKDCLSLAVDDVPILDRKTPVQVYKQFCECFKTSFSHLMGSTITGISMGLGPDGELRYPSHNNNPSKGKSSPGAGEFQCYDANMLSHLKQHAEANGNPLWGLTGPHDGPKYDQSPISTSFFKEQGGSWETPYGDFFLSWYSSQLLSHGDRLLSLATSTFSDTGVMVSGKLPLMYSWCKTRSHPSELTAGFYNTDKKDGYEAIAEMFARNSCKMILDGMDLSDEHQPSRSSPESLLSQITAAFRKNGLEVSGQNALASTAPNGFEQIKKNLIGENAYADSFMYQRMGAFFFSPEHFPAFTEFVRGLNQPELHSDDLPVDEAAVAESLVGKDLRMQTA